MSPTPNQAHARLRAMAASGALRDLCDELGLDILVVFGSVLHAPTTASDLDVAVRFASRADGDILRVVGALVDALHCDRVDVLDLGRAGVVAQEQALVGTDVLYEAEPGGVAALRDRATKLRMDTEWLRRLDLDLMASP